MKKTTLLLLALFIFSFVHAQNQNQENNQSDSTRLQDKNILKMNPLSLLIFRSFNVGYEHAIKPKNSLLIGVNIFQWNNIFEEDLSGVCVQLGYRFYFSKKDLAPEGLFVSPILELGSITSDLNDANQSKEQTFSISVGGRGGYQWVFDNGVALDTYFGYSYYSFKFDTYSEKIKTPVVGISLGYNF